MENADLIDEEFENPASEEVSVSDLNALKEQLTQTKAQLKAEQKSTAKAYKKLEHVEKVACQKIIESMPGSDFEEHTNHLTMLLATVLKHDDFDYDLNSDRVEPRDSTDFLKNLEEQCVDIPDKDAKISFVKNKVLEKMKRTVRRQSMSGSVCSGITSRASSKTRQRSEDGLVDKEPAPKLIKATHVLDRKSRLPAPALHNS